MKLEIEFGEDELKHWPYVFAGVGPKIRAWFKDEKAGALVELPPVQKVQLSYALRPSWSLGHYRIDLI